MTLPDPPPDPHAESVRQVSMATTLALEFCVPMFLGVLIDNMAGTRPWGALGGLVLGFVTGLTHMVGFARRTPPPPRPPADS